MMRCILFFLLIALPVKAAELTPILMANGEAKMVCDGQMRQMNSVQLTNQTVVQSYLFGNLVTPAGYGADVVIWSDAYGGRHPQAQWGTLGDLHIYSQPRGHTGGRQGEFERSFQPDGITITGWVHILAVCWGGGTLETYAQIWVRDGPQ